jgi:uncharacterized membrane protein SpoIIM required for sporulation
MSYKTLIICILIGFIIWAIPFFIRLSIKIETQIVVSQKTPIKDTLENGVVSNIFKAYSTDNKNKAFQLIFINNLKFAILNIVGGVLLGLATLVNLLQNGFYAAGVFSSVHASGMSWREIITYTAPHSFEMIGIWLSGGIGFYIAKSFYNMIVKNKYPTSLFYKTVVSGTIISSLIILIAAFVEAYISVP